MDEENVIDLRTKLEEMPARRKPNAWTHKGCKHDRVEADPETRAVICRSCGASVDLFDWMMTKLVKRWDSIWHQYRSLRDEITRMGAQRDALKKELRSLDGKVKRRKAKLERMG